MISSIDGLFTYITWAACKTHAVARYTERRKIIAMAPPMAWNFLGSRFLQGPPEAAATVALTPPYSAGFGSTRRGEPNAGWCTKVSRLIGAMRPCTLALRHDHGAYQ